MLYLSRSPGRRGAHGLARPLFIERRRQLTMTPDERPIKVAKSVNLWVDPDLMALLTVWA